MSAERKAILELSAVLSAVVQMSDEVKTAKSPLDAQGKLLRLQGSIQKQAPRIAEVVKNALRAAGELV